MTLAGGGRGASESSSWLRYIDLVGTVPGSQRTEVDATLTTHYYEAYKRACLAAKDSSEFEANEVFQQANEGIFGSEAPGTREADRERRAEAVRAVASMHIHDVVTHASDIVESLAASGVASAIFSGEPGDVVAAPLLRMPPEPFQIISHVGAGYVKGGFFFFAWASNVGAKLGRCELRMCTRLLEMQHYAIHVPITYCVSHKGRSVTAQSLVPLDSSNRGAPILMQEYPEVCAIARGITSALNMVGCDTGGGGSRGLSTSAPKGPIISRKSVAGGMMSSRRSTSGVSEAANIGDTTSYMPSGVEAHVASDSRVYFLGNACWCPPLCAFKEARSLPDHRFATMRAVMLTGPLNLVACCCRSLCGDVFVSDNEAHIRNVRELIDVSIHELPRIFGSLTDAQFATAVLARFRESGFNWSMLGILLASLNRNVSPPPELGNAIRSEMFVRGIKSFICRCMYEKDAGETAAARIEFEGIGAAAADPLVGPAKGRSRGLGGIIGGIMDMSMRAASSLNPFPSRKGNKRPLLGGADEDGDEDGDGDGDAEELSASTPTPAAREPEPENEKGLALEMEFAMIYRDVLLSFWNYPGAPVPREATVFRRAIPPPSDYFGQEVVPYIYRKFHLTPDDSVDLYQPIAHAQKMEIYNGVCKKLGIRVDEDGELAMIVPVVSPPSVPEKRPASWIEARVKGLSSVLFSSSSQSREAWQRCGTALVPLLKFFPAKSLIAHLDAASESLETLQPPCIGWQLLGTNGGISDVRSIVDLRENRLAGGASRTEQWDLIRLLRKMALMSKSRPRIAAFYSRVTSHSEALLELCSNPYTPQYRLCWSERLTKVPASGGTQATMAQQMHIVRSIMRHCRQDTLVARDCLHLGLVLYEQGYFRPATVNLQRARHIFCAVCGEMSPEALRCESNILLGDFLISGGANEDSLVGLLQLSKHPNAPPDVLLALQSLFRRAPALRKVPQAAGRDFAAEYQARLDVMADLETSTQYRVLVGGLSIPEPTEA